MKSCVTVALGGALGTLTRYLVDEGLADRLFPVATFLVNITGSFALGALLATLLVRDGGASPRHPLRLLLGTGFLGGYTTYSALAVETDTLLRGDHLALGLSYAVGSVLAGLLAALAGVAAARSVLR
ncbi:CrcB family protein [Aeromicrobium sp.]|uniref:fluoride efflux transporter FluC n=1 Tax=Aeromicrobium sp. TaxID=1871063 RepID=UPI0025C37F02|nr:CrcB family protein [Aeromicrobium sp.]